VLALSSSTDPVPRASLREMTPALAASYAAKTDKTLSRDLNALVDMDLIRRTAEGYVSRREKILAFLPARAEPVLERSNLD
jgi:hypothetical protein